VIFNFTDITHLDKLEAVGAASVYFKPHVGLADNFTLEGAVKGNGYVHLGDLYLNVAGLK
jgi:hypothetical protein